MTGIIIFVLFILYTIACIMDGPDIKPLWKKWLGVKLANIANSYYPIKYCNVQECLYPQKLQNMKNQYLKCKRDNQKLKERISEITSPPPLFIAEIEVKKLENSILIGEDEVFRARQQSEFARQRGYEHLLPPRETVDGLVKNGCEVAMNSIWQTIKDNGLIHFHIDKESRYPGIIVNGYMYVGLQKK